MSYTDVFGGDTVRPSDVSYIAYTLTANITLSWPLDINTADNTAAKIVAVGGGAYSITLPDATEVSPGESILFQNVGASTFSVLDNAGGAVASIATGQAFYVYLAVNTTAAGTWRAFQFGASSSGSSAAALAGYGLKAITTTLNVDTPVTTVAVGFTADATYRAQTYVWTGGVGGVSLTAPATLTDGWFFYLRNNGSGTLTITPLAGAIDSAATLDMTPGDSAVIVTDGTDFFTIGLTPLPTQAFDFTTIGVAGTGNYTLAGTELNRVSYTFTGALTGTRTIIIPASVQQYWVQNGTTGSYQLYVKTSAQTSPGILVPQGSSRIIRCDGTNAAATNTGEKYPIRTFKNRLINGAMLSAQRVATQTGLGAATAYTQCDQWAVLSVGAPQGRVTGDRTTAVLPLGSGFGYSLLLDCTTAEAAVAAGEVIALYQPIEAQFLQDLQYGGSGAKTLVWSGWVRSPKSGTHYAALFGPDGTRSYVRAFTVTAADTYQFFILTFPGDTAGTINNDTGEGLRLVFPLVCGSTFQTTVNSWQSGTFYAGASQQNLLDNTANNFYAAGMMLEVGEFATEYDNISYAAELQRCLRYYYRRTRTAASNAFIGLGKAGTTTAFDSYVSFLVAMRSAPTAVLSAAATVSYLALFAVSSASSFQAGTDSGFWSVDVTASPLTAGQAVYWLLRTNNDYFSYSAEL